LGQSREVSNGPLKQVIEGVTGGTAACHDNGHDGEGRGDGPGISGAGKLPFFSVLLPPLRRRWELFLAIISSHDYLPPTAVKNWSR
jgi:hypothetical protein